MNTTFSAQLRKEADPILRQTYSHPFVQGIAKGDLRPEQLIHYVKQDYEYLNAMIRTRAIAITKCETREDMEMFHRGIAYALYDEGAAHENLCRVAGVTYAELQGSRPAPTAHLYMSHMIAAAAVGTVGDILAATLPCPWIYREIGRRLMQEVNPDRAHPFYDWITIYGRDGGNALDRSFTRLDQLAEEASPGAVNRMRELFLTGCRMEYMFFDMAYKLEEWPV